jgi:hypothetical protein
MNIGLPELLSLFSKITVKGIIVGILIGLITVAIGSFLGDLLGSSESAYDTGGLWGEWLGAILVGAYCYFYLRYSLNEKWKLLSKKQKFFIGFSSGISIPIAFWSTYQSGLRETLENLELIKNFPGKEAISYMLIYGGACLIFGGAIETLIELNSPPIKGGNSEEI